MGRCYLHNWAPKDPESDFGCPGCRAVLAPGALLLTPADKARVGGTKNDSEKSARPELLPVEALEEISKVLALGAKKYEDNNWRRGFKYTRVMGATLRHLYAWARREDNDPETGLSHLAHAACNVLFLLTFVLTVTGEDDRVPA